MTAFTPVLKYIKQLLNLWYLTVIKNKLTTSHNSYVFTKAVKLDQLGAVYMVHYGPAYPGFNEV
jgi:hypothetical protein